MVYQLVRRYTAGVAGAAAAMETADVALLTNDLSRVAETIAIGRLCLSKIKQNIIFSIVTKAIVLCLSLLGYTGLWEAVVFDVGTALAVILNGMTVLNAGGLDEDKNNNGGGGGGGSHSHSHGGGGGDHKMCAGEAFKATEAAAAVLRSGGGGGGGGGPSGCDDALESAERGVARGGSGGGGGGGGGGQPGHSHSHSGGCCPSETKQVFKLKPVEPSAQPVEPPPPPPPPPQQSQSQPVVPPPPQSKPLPPPPPSQQPPPKKS